MLELPNQSTDQEMGVHWRMTRSKSFQGLALLMLSWDKTWDSHSLVNDYPSFYPRIALVAPSPGECDNERTQQVCQPHQLFVLKLLESKARKQLGFSEVWPKNKSCLYSPTTNAPTEYKVDAMSCLEGNARIPPDNQTGGKNETKWWVLGHLNKL